MVYISKKARSFMRNVEGSLRKGASRPYRAPVTSRMNRIANSTTSKLDYLQKKVNKLSVVAKQRINYGQQINVSCFTAGGLDSYQADPIVKMNNWSRIFGTDADDETGKQAIIKSAKFNWYLGTNENEPRTFSIFVVSLKDEASDLLQTDGTLGALTSGTHYYSSQMQTLINLKYFNLHYHKRIITGLNNGAVGALGGAPAVQTIPSTTSDMHKKGTFKLNYGGGKGMVIRNPGGDWKAGIYPKDPSKNYFILTFWSGDSAVDGQYGTFNYSGVTSVDVST